MAKAQKSVVAKKSSDFMGGVKWLFSIALLVAGIVANYYYIHVATPIRTAIGLLICCLVLGILASTEQGRKAWKFLGSARAEMRKVVWPTRQETVQMTTIVLIIVIVLSFILWGVDSGFRALVSWITLP